MSLSWNSPRRLGQPASQGASGINLSLPPEGYDTSHLFIYFLCGCWKSNSVHHACAADTLATELSPHHNNVVFKKLYGATGISQWVELSPAKHDGLT